MDLVGPALHQMGSLLGTWLVRTAWFHAQAAAEVSDLLFFREINSFLTS